MEEMQFHPKVFYRKLDSLIARIGEGVSTREVLSLVLDELVETFASDLKISSGCIYSLRGKSYYLYKGPVGHAVREWPEVVSKDDASVKLLIKHKHYIFCDGIVPPWGETSVGMAIGEENQYLLIFGLSDGWERESLEFSLNTIRSIINYKRSASRMIADMEKAREIQMSLLPKEDPVLEGFDISGKSIAAELVGGDLYDFQVLDDTILGIAVGDASGHGLPAALLARDVVTGLRMGVEREMKISGVVSKLNRVIHQSSLSTRFVSLVYGELEVNGTFVYVNAGHPPPLLFKGDSVEKLTTGGMILGPMEEVVFKRGFAFVDPGDILFLYSDGVVERDNMKDEAFGTERLVEFIKKNRNRPSNEILEELFKTLIAFGEGEKFKDDVTAIVVRRLKQ